MANLTPKINLIYFKNILDNAFNRFFEEHNDDFTRVNGTYVFSSSISRSSLKKKFERYVNDEIMSLTTDSSVINPNFYFIIGSCYPCDNILLNYEDDNKKFSKNLKKLLTEHSDIKYFVKESDIKIGNEMFNCIVEEIFNHLLDHRNLVKILGKKRSNVFMIKNARLDCYVTYRIIKDMFGNVNTINLYKQNISNMKNVIRSVNEIIGSFVTKKKEISRSKDLEFLRREVEQRVNNCILGNIE